MAVLGNTLRYEEMRVKAFGDITNAYTSLGAATDPAVFQYEIINDTDKLLYFSLDGSTNHFAIPAYVHKVIDICANKSNNHFFMRSGQEVFVKYPSGAPTSGNVYFITMFAGVRAA